MDTTMLPTQLITITLMPLELIHAYYVQADLMFLVWLNCYTSSLLYHFTKQYYPLKERIQRPLYYYDVLSVTLVYLAGTYSLLFHAANTYGIWLSWALHLTHPIVYIVAGINKKLMWQEDFIAAELWHSAFHGIVPPSIKLRPHSFEWGRNFILALVLRIKLRPL